jgi:beta-lactamase regulating signal transducer with metallopeptidase domain
MMEGLLGSLDVGEWLLLCGVRGSAMILVVGGGLLALRRWIFPEWRVALWLLVAMRLLLPVEFSIFNIQYQKTPMTSGGQAATLLVSEGGIPWLWQQIRKALPDPEVRTRGLRWGILLWALGVAAGAVTMGCQTWRARRCFIARRLSTDARLLGLLEDCKDRMSMHVPVGLVVMPGIHSAALLGWIRPRILLPESWLHRFDDEQWKHIFLHELAHWKRADIQINWLMAMVTLLNWFNPLVWWMAAQVRKDQEEACDRKVLSVLEGAPLPYGETLLNVLKENVFPRPMVGALGIGEPNGHLKERMHMIRHYSNHTKNNWLCLGVVCMAGLLGGLFNPLYAEAGDESSKKEAALKAAEAWLEVVDRGDYSQSWKEASLLFQKAVTEEKWIEALGKVKTPLGKLLSRKRASQSYLTSLPEGLKGEFVVTQFAASYENMPKATETVTFEREKDGQWRASGYFIRP